MLKNLFPSTFLVALMLGCGTDPTYTHLPTDAGQHTDAAQQNVQPDAQPAPAHPTQDACIIADEHGEYLVTWDAIEKVKSQHLTDAADSAVRLAWRYDTTGRLVAYAGFGPGTYDNFQHDYQFDEHGNVKDFRLSYPQHPDLGVPSPADTWMGTSYANEYDANGQLTASTATPYGPGNNSASVVHMTFEEDADRRCHRIERHNDGDDSGSVEIRDYDDAGRLHTSATDYTGSGGQPFWMPCASTITIDEYDDAGRIENSTRKAAPDRGCSAEAQARPFYTQHYDYAADGGARIESFDYTTDTPNEMITVDGKDLWVGHGVETRTSGCASIDAQIVANSDDACKVL